MKKIFFLRSGVRNALANAVSTPALPLLFDSPVVTEHLSGRPRPRRTGRLYQGIAGKHASPTSPDRHRGPRAPRVGTPGTTTAAGRPRQVDRRLTARAARLELQPGDPVGPPSSGWRCRSGRSAGRGCPGRRRPSSARRRSRRPRGRRRSACPPACRGARCVELDHRDLVEPVLHHVEGAAAQQQAVAVGQLGPAQVDRAGHPVRGSTRYSRPVAEFTTSSERRSGLCTIPLALLSAGACTQSPERDGADARPSRVALPGHAVELRPFASR